MYRCLFLSAAIIFIVTATVACSSVTASATAIPDPAVDVPLASSKGEQTAVLAGGCFWGVEAVFEHVKGVTEVKSGYSGGSPVTAQYEKVGTGETGHAESVRITYDPSQISYGQLLKVFFSVAHDPTELNRQGPDTGTQYRSAIFYHSPAQKAAAHASKEKIGQSGRFRRPIVTQIEPAPKFWRAEEYHQRYLEKRGQSHCAI